MRPFATLPALLALFAAACSDVPGPVSSAPEPSPEGFQTELACTASVREGRVSCADEALEGGSGAFPRLIIGGQNVYVRLASSGASYDASDSIFRVNVTVQNLMTQAFGTPDGTTDTGLRVFFHTGPDVTRGTGSVSVDNEDGSDTFLNAMTPYFAYGDVLYTNDVSEAKTWRFKVDPGVETFNFTVLVQGQLPHAGSLLLFRTLYGRTPSYPIIGIWGPSASDVFAVGHGMMLRYTGGAWVRDRVPNDKILGDVWGASTSDVYAVGYDLIVHWNGTEWSTVNVNPLCVDGYEGGWFVTHCPFFAAVWGSGPDDVWVVGDLSGGLDGYDYRGVIAHYDGERWVSTDTVYAALTGVWGSAANDVWAVGRYGLMLHYDGTAWTYVDKLPPTGDFGGVWGLSSTNVYAPYSGLYPPYDELHEGGVLHYDGVEWRRMPGFTGHPSWTYSSVWGTAPDNLFVASPWGLNLGIKHWDGSTWTDMNRGSNVTSLWGFGPNDVLANIDGGISRSTR